ncbi:MAG: 3-phenylpropionate/cinnamic acid dioxygenase subunit beta [Gammaproteobacteria bacterium]
MNDTTYPASGVFVPPAVQVEIEQFLAAEARLLDTRKFAAWFELLADDIHYYMPIRANVYDNEVRAGHRAGYGGANFDDDKERMGLRVRKLLTGKDHVERPPSLIRHHVTNVYVTSLSNLNTYEVCSYFIVYRNRHGRYRDIYSGERVDTLRRAGTSLGWEIARRHIYLDESTLAGGGIGFFF